MFKRAILRMHDTTNNFFRLLQQQLEEIKTGCPQDSWLTYFQDLVQKCSQHSNEYNILSEKENSVRKELAALSEEKFTTLLRYHSS